MSQRAGPTGSAPVALTSARNSSAAPRVVAYTPEGKQVPLENGGVGPGYWWAQSLTDVTVYVPLPASVSSRDVVCSVEAQHLTVGARGDPPVIDGRLFARVKATESIWSLDSAAERPQRPVDPREAAPPGARGALAADSLAAESISAAVAPAKVLSLTLDKVIPTWWRCLTEGQGHPEIDATMVSGWRACAGQ
jgi:hypothetical protein